MVVRDRPTRLPEWQGVRRRTITENMSERSRMVLSPFPVNAHREASVKWVGPLRELGHTGDQP